MRAMLVLEPAMNDASDALGIPLPFIRIYIGSFHLAISGCSKFAFWMYGDSVAAAKANRR